MSREFVRTTLACWRLMTGDWGLNEERFAERGWNVITGICTIKLRIAGAESLKDKRRVIKSLIGRIKSRYNVSISEVEDMDSWQLATIGVAFVSNSTVHVHQTLDSLLDFVEAFGQVELIHFEKEIL
ncbi:DUF503 domain-containing protein [Zhaonella formicivorans]|uniref:DUF503 domain-containing protein n=1 Tax=Zhaonella formicivorans TaxID=2528593 RepID=UPI001D102B26|nr:DUF503 domain-containing protein [Zhaonella formicivorans]